MIDAYGAWTTAPERAALDFFHGDYFKSGQTSKEQTFTNIGLSLQAAALATPVRMSSGLPRNRLINPDIDTGSVFVPAITGEDLAGKLISPTSVLRRIDDDLRGIGTRKLGYRSAPDGLLPVADNGVLEDVGFGFSRYDGSGLGAAQGLNVDPSSPRAGKSGVYFFDEQVLPYINRKSATLGQEDSAQFFMPLEDSAVVVGPATAYRHSGGAPSLERAYVTNGNVYGVEFPLDGYSPRLPTAADTNLSHFLEGGRTALKLPNNGGYLVNPTREFVIPGGEYMPSGSILFKVEPDGSRTIIRNW